MHISEILAHAPTFSFEFFPPRTEKGWGRLYRTIRELEPLKPGFVSVTYGAGGQTREQTHELVTRIQAETSLDPIPHLTCVCHSRGEIAAILSRYAEMGISNIMALGGDPPRDHSGDCSSDFVHAADLVEMIAGRPHPDPRGFGVGVAGFPEGHPGTPNRMLEIDYLKRKVDAGADYICTQLFFDNRDFYDFRERCLIAGITVPIIAGLMPIISRRNFQRIPETSLGARYPAPLLRALSSVADDADISKIGLDWTLAQCHDLIENQVSGIHFYTMNQSRAAVTVYESLGLSARG